MAQLIGYGSAFITIFLLSNSVTDPVNATKFIALGAAGCAVLAIWLRGGFLKNFKSNKFIFVSVISFVCSGILSIILSQLPMSQNLFGAYGRNSGLLTYIFLSFLLLGALSIGSEKEMNILMVGMAIAGLINVAYCLWVIAFGDFIGWNNPYGNILGTLGNPNFIGAFLGMFFSICMAFVFDSKLEVKYRVALVFLSLLTLFEIYDSSAIQGRVVSAVGLGTVLFFFIRSRLSNIITAAYSAVFVGLAALAGFGALQIGPLTDLIYKYSVTLRGQYWLAGWNTGTANPLHGVGMDGFGDWYRRARDIQALTTPGVNTVVNAAHNVFLDMFAFGGWPLFLSYIAIMVFGGIALLRVTLRSKVYDRTFVGIAVAWLGYQLQSLISINQIGLAVWGWVLTGALIAYERNSRTQPDSENLVLNKSKSRFGSKQAQTEVISAKLLAGIGLVVGAIVASPPLASDIKWRQAQVKQSVELLEESLKPSFMNPQHSTRYLVSIQAFESSNLPDLAVKYARVAVKFNPENFELWKVLYLISGSTPEEKDEALENMKRLDPLNPDVTSRT